ncbi:MAG: hypothetical protein V4640_00130 [Verrucomicrobiota bacterium]
MHLYRQPIVVFGIVLPIVAAGIVVGIGYMAKSRMEASYTNKEGSYKAEQMSRMQAQQIEAQVTRQQEDVKRWEEQLAQESASSLTTNLREISEHLPKKEFQQTAFDPSNTKGGFGASTAQSSSQLRVAFRGSFRTMQRAFLELETRMPQLQLQDLKIDPSTSQSSLLNFQVTYTAWEL